MSLAKFIKQENFMISLFDHNDDKCFPVDQKALTAEHKQKLADRLACALSPENLCCDGELRGAQLRAKAALLNNAKAELAAMGVTHEWW